MKLFKEVIKDNLKMILFYVLIGIAINILDLYGVTYYQKIGADRLTQEVEDGATASRDVLVNFICFYKYY